MGKILKINKIRVVIILIILLSMTNIKTSQADSIEAAGPYEVAIQFSSITPSPSFINQGVTVSVLVNSIDPLGGTPNGTVEVKSGNLSVCNINLDASGRGSCLFSFSTPGVIPLQAFYAGTDLYLPAVSSVYSHQVRNKFTPQILITGDTPDPSIINRLVHVNSKISSTWQDIPSGSVTIFRSPQATCQADDRISAVDQCSFNLDTQGEGACDLSLSAPGNISICAYYDGDTAHFPGVSQAERHVVSQSNSFIDVISITPSPSILNETITVNFSVTSPDGIPQNGSVSIFSGSKLMCTAPVSAGSCQFDPQEPNEHILYATYSGELISTITLDPSVSNPVSHFVYAPPTKILLDKTKINAFRDQQNVAATISALDPNPGDSFTFRLVNGIGNEDNAAFTIQGNQLIALGNIPYQDSLLNIRLRATDPYGLNYEETFQLTLINNLPELPDTGFPQNQISQRPMFSFVYQSYPYLRIQIPAASVDTNIVGVPLKSTGWDTSWLGNDAGWLNGSAFPGWGGNSVLAAHNYLPNGLPGPFSEISSLTWGDQIILQVYGTTLVYEVRQVEWVAPSQNQILSHLDGNWLTLITCDQYDEALETYRWRVAVTAELIQVY